MKIQRLNRRSFFATLAGAAVAGGALTAVTGRSAWAVPPAGGSAPARPREPCSDTDPTDRAGQGRNCNPALNTGVSDHDANDAAGQGRGRTSGPRRPYTGRNDRDPSDAAGYGR
jgi:hypothetical protein